MSLPSLGIRRLLGARCNYRPSCTWHWTTKSILRPLRTELLSIEYSSFGGHTGSESPPSVGSSGMKYDRGRRALPLPLPLPVDIIGFLPNPIPAPVPVVSTSTSTSTSTSEYPPPDAMTKKRRGRREGNTADFIARAVETHGDQYDYSLSDYGERNNDKVVILCTRHDPPIQFEMRPANHLSGRGCRVCGIARRSQKKRGSTADFIARAVGKHGDQYDYSLTEYGKTAHDKVVILCTRHDPLVAFEQSPSQHLSGQGCPLCSKSRRYSKESIKWLDYVAKQSNPPIVIKHAENGGEYIIRYGSNTFHADGYCAETNTVYEFHGSYWHGDPAVYSREQILLRKTAGQLYDETIDRENIIKSLGYNLVVIWESEWSEMI
jgi:hypothetical protein